MALLVSRVGRDGLGSIRTPKKGKEKKKKSENRRGNEKSGKLEKKGNSTWNSRYRRWKKKPPNLSFSWPKRLIFSALTSAHHRLLATHPSSNSTSHPSHPPPSPISVLTSLLSSPLFPPFFLLYSPPSASSYSANIRCIPSHLVIGSHPPPPLFVSLSFVGSLSS